MFVVVAVVGRVVGGWVGACPSGGCCSPGIGDGNEDKGMRRLEDIEEMIYEDRGGETWLELSRTRFAKSSALALSALAFLYTCKGQTKGPKSRENPKSINNYRSKKNKKETNAIQAKASADTQGTPHTHTQREPDKKTKTLKQTKTPEINKKTRKNA